MGSNGWYTSDVTFSVVDGSDILSGHKSTTVSPTSITSNTTGKSVTVTTIDNAGNTKSKTFGPYKIDKSKPTFTVKSSSVETVIEGENHVITSYFNTPDWSVSGEGSIVCQSGSTTITNTNSLVVGTHEITCTATGVNGLTELASKTIEVNSAYVEPNFPSLSNGLIPIKWNGSNWIKADKNNPSGSNQWYDYEKQMWANAASVTSSYRNVSVGTTIPESAINAYFVWISRYEYDYVSIANYAGGRAEIPGEIKVNFVMKSKTTPSVNYKIHPAFTFGDLELSGIWVGKFEASAASGSSCFTSPSTSNCNNTSQTPYIKPNVNSLRYMTVRNMFTTAQKFSASGNSYGISTNADAHMMKNSEWGAVAYLSQSKYGKYGNSSYSGANKEVYINNNSNYITGCSGGAPGLIKSDLCTYTYEKNSEGTGASTTGTIYGIYDMSGGAEEYVMGLYYSHQGSIWGSSSGSTHSGFYSAPAAKYYDEYATTPSATACSSGICYGHALSETSGWYSDVSEFVNSAYAWYIRGGCADFNIYTNVGVGMFTSRSSLGASSSNTFRVVMIDD